MQASAAVRKKMQLGRENQAAKREGEKNAAEAALKGLETSFDEGVTSRKRKHSRDAAIDLVQNPQLTV
ncbi:hypothetical protein [Paraburkholderia sp. RL18-085-BIA-A]|uniref:hypothetical protein n=1 Tax=Paraburkholderia sp. RL18-085-BIA-A TaxID=3031633 RepID=UPI0038BC2DF3